MSGCAGNGMHLDGMRARHLPKRESKRNEGSILDFQKLMPMSMKRMQVSWNALFYNNKNAQLKEHKQAKRSK